MNPHRLFLTVSLAISALVGTALGMGMLLAWLGRVSAARFPEMLSAHAQLQVYGFVVLFTMGVAMMVLPRFLRSTLQPAWAAYLCLAFMLAGTGLNLTGPTVLGASLQTLATVVFVGVIRTTRRSAPPIRREKSPLTASHALFLATGAMWLMASPVLAFRDPTQALETVLWGFAGLYIAGIGLRVHTGILGIKGLHQKLLIPSAAFWNLALLLRWLVPGIVWTITLAIGVGLFLLALRPFRRSYLPPAGGAWLRLFVRTSYGWLVVATIMGLLVESGQSFLSGPGRHALASGFILTMMIGMGLRMIPAFEKKRLIWPGGAWVVYAGVTIGGVLRVSAQAVGNIPLLAVGGALQALSILGFIALILGTMFAGQEVVCEIPRGQPEGAPKFLMDQEAS